MKLKETFTEAAYSVSVESNTDTSFNIKIDDFSFCVFKDEWEKIKKFIDNSIDFIEKNE